MKCYFLRCNIILTTINEQIQKSSKTISCCTGPEYIASNQLKNLFVTRTTLCNILNLLSYSSLIRLYNITG